MLYNTRIKSSIMLASVLAAAISFSACSTVNNGIEAVTPEPVQEGSPVTAGIPENTVFSHEFNGLISTDYVLDLPALPAVLPGGVIDFDTSAHRSFFELNESLSDASVNLLGGEYDKLIQTNAYSDQNVTIINNNGSSLSTDTTALQKLLGQSSKEVGFIAVRLSDGASIGYNVDGYFSTCSTIKAAYCLYASKLVDEGKAFFDRSFTYTPSSYISGSGIIQRAEFGTRYTLKTLIKYAITKSDNIAHNMLCSGLSLSGFYQMLDRMNCNVPTNDYTNWPDITARSAALWWSEIYSFREQSKVGAWYWDLLEDNFSWVSPALDKPVHSKTGSSTYNFHETGIVMGDCPYIITLFTKSGSAASQSYFTKIIREIDRIICS